jgi:outer membrane beta-barrel protein
LLSASLAHAEEPAGGADFTAGAAATDPAAGIAAPAAPAVAPAPPGGATAAEIDRYWAVRRAVSVVQRRLYPKAGKAEIEIGTGMIANDAFLLYLPLVARIGYHISEHWGLEASFEYNFAIDSKLRDFLQSHDAAIQATLRDRQQLRFALDAVWSPLYGKLALGRRHAIHFDVYFVAGIGAVRTTAVPEIGLAAAIGPEGNIGAGVKVFLTRFLALRFEYHQYLFKHPEDQAGEGGEMAFPSEFGLGVSFLFGRSPKEP